MWYVVRDGLGYEHNIYWPHRMNVGYRVTLCCVGECVIVKEQ